MSHVEPPEALPHGLMSHLEGAVAAGVCSAAALGIVLAEGRRHVGWSGRLHAWRGPEGPNGWQPDPGPPLVASSLWDLASLTKPMAVTTLVCRELGRPDGPLQLDRPLGELLADARPQALAGATLAQLLGHASGAPAWRDFYAQTAALAARPTARAAEIRRLVLATALQQPAGQRAEYSDLGFMALGWALEATLGAPLDALFAERVAGPLGLRQSGFRRLGQPLSPADVCATEVWPSRCPDGLPLRGEVHDDNCAGLHGVAGHAGLFASLGDVLTWAEAWLRAARGDESGLLAPRAVGALIGQSAAPSTTWRLGWDTASAAGSSAGAGVSPSAFGHLGFTGTSVWIDPARGAAAVLLTNRVHPSREPHAPIKALRPVVHGAIWRWLAAVRSNR